jgi:DNA ligase (NAD+)
MDALSNQLFKLKEKDYKEYIQKSELNILYQLKIYLDDKYYNTSETILRDKRYDYLKDSLIKRDINYIPTIGSEISKKDRVNLEYWLGSVDKITPSEEKELSRWKDKNNSESYLTTEKLDGVSGMFIHKDGKYSLFTRGDGIIGGDISYLIKHISSIPNNLKENIVVRGELIMEKKVFESKYKQDSIKKIAKKTYKHSRNMIAGMVGSKTINEGVVDIKFIVYEIIGDKLMDTPINQLKKLEKLGFTVAMFKEVKEILDIKILEDLHATFKKKSKFEIDGIIIQSNSKYERNTSGNPSYMFAFKVNGIDNIVETTVMYIEWSVTKWGQIIPVAIIEPIELPGVTISRVTVSNAGLMVEKMIGPGCIINVTRSKEVIPYIVDVVEKCENLKYPDIKYEWDENRVHLNVIEPSKEIVAIMKVKMIASFFDKMGIKHVSEQTVKKMYNKGLDTLLKIISCDKKKLMKIVEFKEKSAERITENIKKGLQNIKVEDLLSASGIFGSGVGKRRVTSLMTDIPDLLCGKKTGLKKRIMEVDGFSEIITNKVYNNIDKAIEFIDSVSEYVNFAEDTRVSNDFVGLKFVFSGFRSKELEQEITNRGGTVTTSVSKKTSGLIVADVGDKEGKTGKAIKALECGVKIYTKEEFKNSFKI